MKHDISALMDGELDHATAKAVIARLKHEEELKNAWADYHLISDILRQSSAFLPRLERRVRQKLEGEPTVLAPRRQAWTQKAKFVALYATASLSAVAMVAWVVLQNYTGKPKENLAATTLSTTQATLASLPKYPISNNVHEYLLAHQEFSPSTTMQGVASYVRTVSDEGKEAGR
jgi:sigma-E factor negative regulatory protein RseA